MENAKNIEKVVETNGVNFKDMTWSEVKKRVLFEVAGEETQREKQTESLIRKMGDMTLIYQFVLESDGNKMKTCEITNSMQKQFGATEKMLHEAAMENMQRMFPVELKSMITVMEEAMLGNEEKHENLEETLQEINKDSDMYVLTNPDKQYGAATIFYPDVMDKIVKAFDDDFFILPSSIQEVILVKCPKEEIEETIAALRSMVRDINEAHVEPKERLSNQVYIYSRDKKEIQIAEEWLTEIKQKTTKGKTSIKEVLGQKKRQLDETPVQKPNNLDMER